MATITITVEDLRDPFDSERQLIHLDCGLECSGEYCSTFQVSEPHEHVVVSGENPKTSPRYFRV